MLQKQHIKILLISGLFLISLGGWFLHCRMHPIARDKANFIPFLAGIISVVLVPILFSFKKSVAYGYVINGMIVIVGTITMGHFVLAYLPQKLSFSGLILDTLFPYIVILWTKFLMGKALFDLDRMSSTEMPHKGRFFRYPNMGWWWVHLITLSIVYGLGHWLW
jgi:hypothetical protein